MTMADKQKEKMVIDMGELPNLTPEERRKATYIAMTEKHDAQRQQIIAKHRAKFEADRKAKAEKAKK